MKKEILVVTSLDVEEEGLFCGKYARKNVQVANVEELKILEPLTSELGYPLTLFCAYSVFDNEEALKTISFCHEKWGAEIGAHLHHWSTPPFDEKAPEKPERTHTLTKEKLISRLANLLEKGRDFLGKPMTSFRMGRWDLKAQLLPLLAERGIKVDSSVCPLRAFKDGANHFDAPADPYWVNLPNGGKILEAPITQISLFPWLAKGWQAVCPNPSLLDLFHFFGALSVNPFWHGSKIMRLATRLHIARGGKVINLFWHSSELMPGASPHVPDLNARNRILRKILSYLAWLRDNFTVKAITISELTNLPVNFPKYILGREKDW